MDRVERKNRFLPSFQGELFPEYAPETLELVFRTRKIDRAVSLRRPEQFVVFRQEEPYSCGSACLRMVFQYFWVPVAEEEIRLVGHQAEQYLRSIEKLEGHKGQDEGIGSTGIMAALRHYRMRGLIVKGEKNSLENLAWFLARDIPVIVNWQYEHDGFSWPFKGMPIYLGACRVNNRRAGSGRRVGLCGHYSVAVGFSDDRERVILADPSGNAYFVGRGYFESKWWDPSPIHQRWMVAVYRDGAINSLLRKTFRGLFV